MLELPLRLIAIVTSLLIVASFAMFGRDQLSGASNHQQAELTTGRNDIPLTTEAKGAKHQPRKFIDGAAKQLESPFSGLVNGSSSPWVRQVVPALLGLLLYGAGIGYLARFARGRAGHTAPAAS